MKKGVVLNALGKRRFVHRMRTVYQSLSGGRSNRNEAGKALHKQRAFAPDAGDCFSAWPVNAIRS
jgi:hypothetical protein